MTEYIEVPVKKRNFIIPIQLPEVSGTAVTLVNADDTYIARNEDIYIARNGDNYIAHNTTPNVYPRTVKTKKRNFTVVVEVRNA